MVGDIADEYDEPVRTTSETRDGHYIVDGRTSRGDIEETIGLRLPRGPYETVAGFLLEQFGSVPLVGEQLEWQGWKFEIVSRDNLRIAEISVERPPESELLPPGQGEES